MGKILNVDRHLPLCVAEISKSFGSQGQGYSIVRSYQGQMKRNQFSVYHKCFFDLCVTRVGMSSMPPDSFLLRGDQRGGMHINEKSHVKLITIGSNGLYWRRKRFNLNPSISI